MDERRKEKTYFLILDESYNHCLLATALLPQPDSACVPGYVMTDWTEEQLDQVTSPTIPSTSLTNPSSAVDRRPQGGRLRQDEPQAEAVHSGGIPGRAHPVFLY